MSFDPLKIVDYHSWKRTFIRGMPMPFYNERDSHAYMANELIFNGLNSVGFYGVVIEPSRSSCF